MKNRSFQSLTQNFFMDRLLNQMKVSQCTIESYRDTFRLFLKYMSEVAMISPSSIKMIDINAEQIINFLNYLEKSRENLPQTINNRLAAIKSFSEYVSFEAPEYLNITEKIKKIPFRKVIKKNICYLTKEEIDSILDTCDTSIREGKRDYLIILILYNTGFRVSELINIKIKDIFFSENNKATIKILGKGRKERIVPVWQNTCKYLRGYIGDSKLEQEDYLLSGKNVSHLTRSGVRYRLDKIIKKASINTPSIKLKKISPHIFRHSTAMGLLQSGIDLSTISIWLGHENIQTTHKYMVADIKLKEIALSKLSEPKEKKSFVKYKPSKDIIDFLNTL